MLGRFCNQETNTFFIPNCCALFRIQEDQFVLTWGARKYSFKAKVQGMEDPSKWSKLGFVAILDTYHFFPCIIGIYVQGDTFYQPSCNKSCCSTSLLFFFLSSLFVLAIHSLKLILFVRVLNGLSYPGAGLKPKFHYLIQTVQRDLLTLLQWSTWFILGGHILINLCDIESVLHRKKLYLLFSHL